VGYRVLATVILVAHFAFLAYLVLGGLLAVRWRWTFWPHAAAALWGLLVVAVPLDCPLTWAENWARRHGGQAAVQKGFIDRYITGVLYPERYLMLMRILVAVVVLGSWTLVLLRWRAARHRLAGG
jgi:hypothetical protein